MQPQPRAAGQFGLESRIRRRVNNLPAQLQAHIARAQDVARALARRHDLDPERAALGILAHDVARAMPGRELLERAARFGLPIGAVEQQVPLLLHGPVGAEILRREEGLTAATGAEELYRAVYWHTTAHPTLEPLGKVVFLADKLDPHKRKRYPYQPQILALAYTDLDAAILEFLTRQVIDLANRGHLVHPTMLEARNALLAGSREAGSRGAGSERSGRGGDEAAANATRLPSAAAPGEG